MIAELMIDYIKNHLDPAQYANQKGISLQHYLINMIDKILSDTDNNSRGEINAVIATLYDWQEAFPGYVCHCVSSLCIYLSTCTCHLLAIILIDVK